MQFEIMFEYTTVKLVIRASLRAYRVFIVCLSVRILCFFDSHFKASDKLLNEKDQIKLNVLLSHRQIEDASSAQR